MVCGQHSRTMELQAAGEQPVRDQGGWGEGGRAAPPSITTPAAREQEGGLGNGALGGVWPGRGCPVCVLAGPSQSWILFAETQL